MNLAESETVMCASYVRTPLLCFSNPARCASYTTCGHNVTIGAVATSSSQRTSPGSGREHGDARGDIAQFVVILLAVLRRCDPNDLGESRTE
jgi:hypothetical protein